MLVSLLYQQAKTMRALTRVVIFYSCNYHNQENPFKNGVNVGALKKYAHLPSG